MSTTAILSIVFGFLFSLWISKYFSFKKKSSKKKASFNINNEIKNLKKGYLNFNCPESVKLEDKFKVKVSIGNKKGLFDTLSNQIEHIETGEIMKLTLKGDNFEIHNLNNEKQFTIHDKLTNWEWDVKAKKAGIQILNLLVSVQLNSPKSGVGYIDYPILNKKIKIKVNIINSAKKFFQKYWNWLIGLLVGSGLIWKIIEYFY